MFSRLAKASLAATRQRALYSTAAPEVTSPFKLAQDKIEQEKSLDDLKEDTTWDSVIFPLVGLLPEASSEIQPLHEWYEPFSNQRIFYSSLPEPFKELTPESLETYIEQLTHHLYPKQNGTVKAIIDEIMKSEPATKLFTKNTMLYLTEYFLRKGSYKSAFKIRNDICPAKEYGPEFFELLFRYADNDKDNSLLKKHISNMKESGVNVDSNILYRVYYAMPKSERANFLQILKSKGLEPSSIIPDAELTASEDLGSMLSRVEATPGVIQTVVQVMLSQHRFNMARDYITFQALALGKDIPISVGFQILEYLVREQPYLALGFAGSFRRLTGKNLKATALALLMDKQLKVTPVDQGWLELAKRLSHEGFMTHDTAIKHNLPRRLSKVAKKNGLDWNSSFTQKSAKQQAALQLPLESLFSQKHKADLESLRRLFNAKDIATVEGKVNKLDLPASFKYVAEKQGPVQRLAAISLLKRVAAKNPVQALALAELFKRLHHNDLYYEALCSLISPALAKSSKEADPIAWFITRWLYNRTKYNDQWGNDAERKDQRRRSEQLNGSKVHDFTDADKQIADELEASLKWEADEPDFEQFTSDLEEYVKPFITGASS